MPGPKGERAEGGSWKVCPRREARTVLSHVLNGKGRAGRGLGEGWAWGRGWVMVVRRTSSPSRTSSSKVQP